MNITRLCPMTRSMLWRWPAALTSRSCSCLPVPALLHDGALDADALTKIFTFVKTTADYYGMADYINTEMDGVSSQSYDNADIVTIDAQQDEYSTCSRAKFGWMDVATPYAVIAMARTNDIFDADAEAVPVDMIPMPGLTQGAYNPQVLVGVNANSKNPDAAKGLAAAFFGTDVQSQYCSDGTTVRADCLREKLDAVNDGLGMVYKVLLQHHREQYRCGAVGVEGIQEIGRAHV